MTAIIPLDQWPDWADRHCWDEDGGGFFFGTKRIRKGWVTDYGRSGIPMPAGWDWRVPVMRPTVKDSLMVSPAIDLEQFWKLSDSWLAQAERVRALAPDKSTGLWAAAKELRDMLTLIDGQANVRSSYDRSSEVAANLVTDDAVRRLVRAMENTPGDELIEPNTRLCRRLLAAALQPTKGEGE